MKKIFFYIDIQTIFPLYSEMKKLSSTGIELKPLHIHSEKRNNLNKNHGKWSLSI